MNEHSCSSNELNKVQLNKIWYQTFKSCSEINEAPRKEFSAAQLVSLKDGFTVFTPTHTFSCEHLKSASKCNEKI